MSNASTPNGRNQGSRQTRSVAIVGMLSVVLLTAGLVLIAIALASNAQTAGPSVVVVRDLLIIVMALELIVIGTAIVVLLIQAARLVNLLTNEVQPLINSATDTVNTVRGTAQFISRHVTGPIISTAGTVGGISKVVSDVEVIRKAAGILLQAAVSGTPLGGRTGDSHPDGTVGGERPAVDVNSETDREARSEDGASSTSSIRDNF